MKTIRIALTGLALLFTISAIAQTSFGLRGGVNFYNINGKDASGDKLENKLKTGFNVGVNAEIPVGIDFYVQPGVLFSTKGAKHEGTNNTVNLGYIEVPVNFLYKPELGTGRFILGFGPYVAFGVTGKFKLAGGGDSRDIKFQSDVSTAEALSGDYFVKRFDAGGNLLFGYEFTKQVSVQLNAQLGLVDILPDYEGNQLGESTMKNTGFGVSFGYRFVK